MGTVHLQSDIVFLPLPLAYMQRFGMGRPSSVSVLLNTEGDESLMFGNEETIRLQSYKNNLK